MGTFPIQITEQAVTWQTPSSVGVMWNSRYDRYTTHLHSVTITPPYQESDDVCIRKEKPF
jgi:hypothetical protein